ncbi:hypothetical protein DPMN_087273 [Dreissena polymorpha]|uniref:Uncharacterized protein n=1 Tax=Dreissena polymorpha TaxID=45954 RepID=A0A9D4KSP0_DREPO|nr:hypothetical protein DPMN_087273 [Dreissena polymorpha]
MKTYQSRTYEVPQDIGICIGDDLEPGVTSTEQTNQSTEHNDQTYHDPNFDFTEELSAVQIRYN